MSNLLTIINRSLRLIGVQEAGGTASGQLATDCKNALNMMLDQWNNEKLMTFAWTNETFDLVTGTYAYDIGPDSVVITDNAGTISTGYLSITVNNVTINENFATNKNTTLTNLAAHLVSYYPKIIESATYSSAAHTITIVPTGKEVLDVSEDVSNITGTLTMTDALAGDTFNTTRPTKIERAFIRTTSGSDTSDTPLDIIPNNRYQEIYSKNIEGNPIYLNYLPLYPNGKLYLWPAPGETSKIGLSQWKQLIQIDGLSEEIELPVGYETAITYNLAVEMAPEFGKNPSIIVMSKAIETKDILKTINTENYKLTCDSSLIRRGKFDILSSSWI